ncbi:MAG: hypothetical protein ABSA42_19905 [Terracidiphilus sp.]
MLDQPAVKRVFGEGSVIDGPEQVLAVSCARQRDIESLFLFGLILGRVVARPENHRN